MTWLCGLGFGLGYRADGEEGGVEGREDEERTKKARDKGICLVA